MLEKNQEKNWKKKYINLGLPLVRVTKPIHGKSGTGKNPLVAGWNKAYCTDQQVMSWDGNLALRLDYFIVLDVDDPEQFSIIAKGVNIPKCPVVYRGTVDGAVNLKEKAHFYFKRPSWYNDGIVKITDKNGKVIAELRSGSGALCVVPESVHEDGSVYKWHNFDMLNVRSLPECNDLISFFKRFDYSERQSFDQKEISKKSMDEIVIDVLSRTPNCCSSYNDFVRLSLAFKSAGLSYGQIDKVFRSSEGYDQKKNAYLYDRMRENGSITMKTAYFFAKEKNEKLLNMEMERELKESSPKKVDFRHSVSNVVEPVILEKPEKKGEVTFDWKSLPVIGDFVESVSDSTDSPDEFIACSFISALCGAIGNKAYMYFGSSKVAPNIWLAIVGKSSALRKTTAMNIGTKILRILDREKREEYNKEMNEYLRDKENNIPPSEKLNVYPVGVTAERLVEILSQKPDGIFCFSELAQFLKLVDKHSGLKENMTALYDYNDTPLAFETKTQGRYIVKDTAINIVGCSTIEWLQNNLNDSDLMTGFLARFLFSVIREETKRPIPFPEKLIIPNRFESIIRFLDVNSFFEVELSPEAKNYYIDWFYKFREITKEESNMVKASLIRLETVALKFAILFHCLECYQKNKLVKTIEVESMDHACVLTYNYFASNILSCYDELTKSTDMTETKITDIIRKKGKKKTLPDGQEVIMVAKYIVSQYSKLKKKELEEYVDTMVSKNYLTIHTSGTRCYLCVKP